MYTVSVLLVAMLCYSSAKAISGSPNGLIKIRLSPTAQKNNSSDLAVPLKDCGYFFCEAPDVATDETTHLWDYHVDWEMPALAFDDPQVFVLGNDFQMPRSYLVFRGFNGNFEGQYKCVLKFRTKPIASYTLNVSLGDTLSTKNCMGNSP